MHSRHSLFWDIWLTPAIIRVVHDFKTNDPPEKVIHPKRSGHRAPLPRYVFKKYFSLTRGCKINFVHKKGPGTDRESLAPKPRRVVCYPPAHTFVFTMTRTTCTSTTNNHRHGHADVSRLGTATGVNRSVSISRVPCRESLVHVHVTCGIYGWRANVWAKSMLFCTHLMFYKIVVFMSFKRLKVGVFL